jgi:hypothetical protein
MEQDITPWGAPEENHIPEVPKVPVWGEYIAGIDPVHHEGGLADIKIGKRNPDGTVEWIQKAVDEMPKSVMDKIAYPKLIEEMREIADKYTKIPVQAVVCAEETLNKPYESLEELLNELYKLVPIGDHQIQENELLKIIRRTQQTCASGMFLKPGEDE